MIQKMNAHSTKIFLPTLAQLYNGGKAITFSEVEPVLNSFFTIYTKILGFYLF
jgi:hypothetical protein